MVNRNGKVVGISGDEFAIALENFRLQFQSRKILWNGEQKLITTILQDIFEMANGKSNTIISDELPQTTTANTNYMVKTYNGETLKNGRFILATDNLNVLHYIATTEINLDDYLQKIDEPNKLYGTDENGEQKSYDADDLGKTDNSTIEKNINKELQVKNGGITNDKLANDVKIGSLNELKTKDKTNIVDAINEINGLLFTSKKDELIKNEYNTENLEFDKDYHNDLLYNDVLAIISCHCILKEPITDLTTGLRKVMELPFNITNDTIKINYKTKGGKYTNNSGIKEWFVEGGSHYVDKESFKTKKVRVKKYKLDDNGDAIQKVNVSTGELMWTTEGLPVIDYTEVEVDNTEEVEVYTLKIPLNKGTADNTWQVNTHSIKTDYEYLYTLELKILGCIINEEGKIGSYYTKPDSLFNEIGVNQSGCYGVYSFTESDSAIYKNETIANIIDNEININADIPVEEIWIKGILPIIKEEVIDDGI